MTIESGISSNDTNISDYKDIQLISNLNHADWVVRITRQRTAKHLGSMIPRTPTKANDEITKITNSLAARWHLQFPARDATYSPSKVKDPSRPEEQVMNCLRFLVFKDPKGLADALERFEKHAETVFSLWKFKSRADQDVIPRRLPAESSLQRDTLLRRSEITETTADELMKSLLHNLILAAEHVKQTQRTSSSEVYNDAKSKFLLLFRRCDGF